MNFPLEFQGDNPFLLTHSRNDVKKITKSRYPPERIEIDFFPSDDEKEYSENDLHQQIKSTVSSFKEKTIRNEDEVFYVIHPKIQNSNPNIDTILKRLGAEIINFTDEKNEEFIVRASNKKLEVYGAKEKLPKLFTENIHLIRPILFSDQITKNSYNELKKTNRLSILSFMPNSPQENQKKYFDLIKEFFTQKGITDFSSYEEEGLVFAKIQLNEILEFLKKSTFVHFVEPAPFGLANMVKPKIKSKIKSSVSLIEPLTKSHETPLVAILDSGVNKIKPLQNIVYIQDSYHYHDLNDVSGNDGHGTPIGALLSLGENLTESKTRIISYKIFENKNDEESFPGMLNGIEKFREQTRLFLSAVNFEDLNPKLEAKLDRLVQKQNIVFVNSVGNILPEDIANELRSTPYPNYLSKYATLSPSSCLSVVAVGSVASKKYTGTKKFRSIAEINEIAPYSRCKPHNPYLFECYKPELVDYGANLNEHEGSINGEDVGVNSYSKDGNVTSFFGTSFSAPLFMRKIAELETYYGKNIKNAETLKALAFALCIPIKSTCSGLGRSVLSLGCDNDHAMYYCEGHVTLRGESTKEYFENPFSEFTIKVPFTTGRIDLCLVHTDNFMFSNSIILNTYLHVDVWKTASASKVEAINEKDNDKITNIKFLSYSFKQRNMEGKWTFRVYPLLTTKLLNKYKKDIQTRYGIVVLLSRRNSMNRSYSMNHEINNT